MDIILRIGLKKYHILLHFYAVKRAKAIKEDTRVIPFIHLFIYCVDALLL